MLRGNCVSPTSRGLEFNMIEFIIATILLLNPILPSAAATTDYFSFDNQNIGPQKVENGNLGVKLTASNFFVQDTDSEKVLYSQKENEKAPIASLTKLMTALVFLENNPGWEKTVIMEQIDETQGAYPHIYRGESVTVANLFNTMLVSSDNNSAKALVRVSKLSAAEFIVQMNEKAKENGLKNTKFFDVTGLSSKNISTASEISELLMLALEKEEIKNALTKKGYNFSILNNEKSRSIYTTNRLLESFLNSDGHGYEIIGGKTGFLPEAGGCLAVVVEKDGHKIISVILGSDNMETRFEDMKALVDWIYLNYKWN